MPLRAACPTIASRLEKSYSPGFGSTVRHSRVRRITPTFAWPMRSMSAALRSRIGITP
jgi:hypothetical protein